MTAKPDLRFSVSDINAGFNALKIEASGPDVIVRELIQNAYDAAVEAGRETAEITFTREEIPMSAIPGMKSYGEALEASIIRPKDLGEEQQEWPVINMIKGALSESNVNVLWVTDNGIGLSMDKMRKMLSLGNSQKEGASGSVGVGHMTAFLASDIRYIVYGGCCADEKIISGHCILRSHKIGKRRGPSGYFRIERDEDEEVDTYPEAAKVGGIWEKKINEIHKNHGTGSFVCILGFNYFSSPERNLEESIFHTAAAHFMPLVFDKKLVVRCHTEELNHSNMGSFIEKRKEKNALKNATIKIRGAKFFDLYENLRKNSSRPIKVELADFPGETISILLDKSKELTGKGIHLYRNGMSITNDVPQNAPSVFDDYADFNAMLLLDNKSAKNANRLITKAETSTHSSVVYKNSSLIPTEDKRKITKIFNEIQEAVKKRLDKYTAEKSFFSSYISVDGSRAGAAQPAVPRRRDPGPEPGPGPGPNPGPAPGPEPGPRPGPEIVDKKYKRGLPANIKSCFNFIDDRKIMVHVDALEDFDSRYVEVSFIRRSGSDRSCTAPEPDHCVEIAPTAKISNRLIKREDHVPRRKGANEDFVAVRLKNVKKGKFDLEMEVTSVPPPLRALQV